METKCKANITLTARFVLPIIILLAVGIFAYNDFNEISADCFLVTCILFGLAEAYAFCILIERYFKNKKL